MGFRIQRNVNSKKVKEILIKEISKINPYYQDIIPPVVCRLRSFVERDKSTMGFYDRDIIQLSTKEFKHNKISHSTNHAIVTTLFHEIGHLIDDLNFDALSKDLEHYIRYDLQHTSILNISTYKYFLDEVEMFAEMFSFIVLEIDNHFTGVFKETKIIINKRLDAYIADFKAKNFPL